MKEKIFLTQLQGDDILKNVEQCERDGFVDTCKRVLKLIDSGNVTEVTKHEIKFLLAKL